MATKDGRKTGGRQKGTVNKKTLDLQLKFSEHGIDVPDEIVRLLKSDKPPIAGGLTDKDKLGAYLELMQYIYPKRKAVEVSTADPLEIKAEVVYESEWGNNQNYKEEA